MTATDRIATFGTSVQDFLIDIGRLASLAFAAGERVTVGLVRGGRLRPRAVLAQVYRAGNESLALVCLISVLVGMILALQSAHQLRALGVLSLVADLVAVSVVRELAPLLTAILVAGRVGSAVAAELGTMKVSEEIDALHVMGIDPIGFLVVPRLLGLLVAVPCLTLFADLVGILGGCLVGVGVLGMGAEGYLQDSIAALSPEDFWGGIIKAVVFGGLIALVSCHRGLRTRGGATEVGRSTTAAVVGSIVLVIVADLFVTAWLYVRG